MAERVPDLEAAIRYEIEKRDRFERERDAARAEADQLRARVAELEGERDQVVVALAAALSEDPARDVRGHDAISLAQLAAGDLRQHRAQIARLEAALADATARHSR